jgi:hypothetical protein
MSYRRLSLCCAMVLAAGVSSGRVLDESKTDVQTVVAKGKEISLTPVSIALSDKTDDDGVYEATVKPAKDAKKVQMPEEAWVLGFEPKAGKPKDGGVEFASATDDSALSAMRTVAGKADTVGEWNVDPGDIITHVNGFAVNSLEDIVVATSLAKEKKDVQIVLKDQTKGKLLVFYVTAVKQK